MPRWVTRFRCTQVALEDIKSQFPILKISLRVVVIVTTTRITVQSEHRNEFLQTIWPLLEPIRNEKGCHAYRFYFDAADEDSSLLIGEWDTWEDWTNHLSSKDFAVLRGAMTILISPASIDFNLLETVRPKPTLTRTVDRRA